MSVIQARHLVSSWTSASALLRTLSVVATCHVYLDISTITSSHTLKSRSHAVHSMSWDVQKWGYSVRNSTTGMSHKEVRVSFTRTGRWVERVTGSSSGCTFTSTGSTWLSSSSSRSLPFTPRPCLPLLSNKGGRTVADAVAELFIRCSRLLLFIYFRILPSIPDKKMFAWKSTSRTC